MKENRCLIIIPTYNEHANITKLVKKVLLLGEQFCILVVDDNSPDGTGKLVKELIEKYPKRLFILEKEKKSGLGTAYLSGFKWALKRNYDCIFEMDADLSHSPKDLPRFLTETKKADVIVGSRYIKGGRFQGWPWYRILISRCANAVTSFVAQIPVCDLTSGFVCYKKQVLETINLNSIKSEGYSFQIEMKLNCQKEGFKIQEIPITFTERQKGKSKMSRKIAKEAIRFVLRLVAQRLSSTQVLKTIATPRSFRWF